MRDKAPQLRVALYHGPNRVHDFSPALLACHDVVITTYGTMQSECAARPQGALFRVRWHRCALNLFKYPQGFGFLCTWHACRDFLGICLLGYYRCYLPATRATNHGLF